MVQQLTITVDSPASIRPLLESAIRRELVILKLGIEKTEIRLKKFEQKYGMASKEFVNRVRSGDLGDGFDVVEWTGEIKTLNKLQQQQQALQDAKLN